VPYHVRITPKDLRRRSRDALELDKDEHWIEEHIAAPRHQGRDTLVDGQVFTWDSIDKIHITWTDETRASSEGATRTNHSPSERLHRRARRVLPAGTYKFRSRMRNPATGVATGWSPTLTATVP
jgi:hypothetical protein